MRRKEKCPDNLTLSVFADGELGRRLSRRVSRHLSSCQKCRALTAALKEENAAIGLALDTEDRVDGLVTQVMAEIRPYPKSRLEIVPVFAWAVVVLTGFLVPWYMVNTAGGFLNVTGDSAERILISMSSWTGVAVSFLWNSAPRIFEVVVQNLAVSTLLVLVVVIVYLINRIGFEAHKIECCL